ncbi:MAG: DUF378 domain-containing protein [Candidatus Pacearchaeota archaeon]
MAKNALDWIAGVLVIIGAVNWGLVGIGGFAGGNWNVIAYLGDTIANIVYILVGLAGLYTIYMMVKE